MNKYQNQKDPNKRVNEYLFSKYFLQLSMCVLTLCTYNFLLIIISSKKNVSHSFSKYDLNLHQFQSRVRPLTQWYHARQAITGPIDSHWVFHTSILSQTKYRLVNEYTQPIHLGQGMTQVQVIFFFLNCGILGLPNYFLPMSIGVKGKASVFIQGLNWGPESISFGHSHYTSCIVWVRKLSWVLDVWGDLLWVKLPWKITS